MEGSRIADHDESSKYYLDIVRVRRFFRLPAFRRRAVAPSLMMQRTEHSHRRARRSIGDVARERACGHHWRFSTQGRGADVNSRPEISRDPLPRTAKHRQDRRRPLIGIRATWSAQQRCWRLLILLPFARQARLAERAKTVAKVRYPLPEFRRGKYEASPTVPAVETDNDESFVCKCLDACSHGGLGAANLFVQTSNGASATFILQQPDQ